MPPLLRVVEFTGTPAALEQRLNDLEAEGLRLFSIMLSGTTSGLISKSFTIVLRENPAGDIHALDRG